MKKIFIMLFLCVVMCLTGCGDTGTKSNINSKYDKVIVAGVDDEFPPMAFHDKNGALVGFDVDLAKEAAKRLGVELKFKSIDWNQKEFEITSGNIDMIWNGCDILDEYKEYMIFSKPYMDNRQILMVRYGNDKNIHTEGDLTDKLVGTQAGSNSEDYVNITPALKNSFKNFKVYRNVRDALKALSSGEVDVLIIDEIAARYEVINNPKEFETIEATIGPVTEFGIGFRKDDTALRDKVQKVFDSMIKDGTTKKISEKWFNADIIKHVR